MATEDNGTHRRPVVRVKFTLGSDQVEVESERFDQVAALVYFWLAARRPGLTEGQETKFQADLDRVLGRLEKTAE